MRKCREPGETDEADRLRRPRDLVRAGNLRCTPRSLPHRMAQRQISARTSGRKATRTSPLAYGGSSRGVEVGETVAVQYVRGDLLESDCRAIAHQCDCVCAMSSGIARQIRGRYPEAAHADRAYPLRGTDRLGGFSWAWVDQRGMPRIVFNLYGQYQPARLPSLGSRLTDYQALKSALRGALRFTASVLSREVPLGVPWHMGCGLAGGEWSVVERLMAEASADPEHGRDILVYQRHRGAAQQPQSLGLPAPRPQQAPET